MSEFLKKEQNREHLLEPLLRIMRIKKIRPVLNLFTNCILLDIGCGWDARFLQDVEPYIALGVGIDRNAPNIQQSKIYTLSIHLESILPFSESVFDVVTMLAVLEHLEHANAVVAEVYRVLRPGGLFCGTVPSVLAKPVLEFLAYKLKVVNPEEIRDHKQYYTKLSLQNLMNKSNFTLIQHRNFQLGMNNFFIAQK